MHVDTSIHLFILLISACPGFSDKNNFAKGTEQIHLVSKSASTHAGGSFILPGHMSPSGGSEALFGFRGTEFGEAVKEIQRDTAPEAVRAILTVLTGAHRAGGVCFDWWWIADLNIARQDVKWTLDNGTEIDLGYVHQGFWDAVHPFIVPLLGNASDYVKA